MNTDSFFFHLSLVEEETAQLYEFLSDLTFSMPKVQALFGRLSQEEIAHGKHIQLAKNYQSQAAGVFSTLSGSLDKIQQARQALVAMKEELSATPPAPPFISLLESIRSYEEKLEAQHYSAYLLVDDADLKALLMQLTQYDNLHVAMIAKTLADIKMAMDEGPEP